LLIALKDLNNNNKFDPKKERLDLSNILSFPNDTVYELELFKETLLFKAFKPNQTSGNRLLMSYEGNMKLAESRPKIILKKQRYHSNNYHSVS
jgi:hypothetical protein